MLTSQQIGTVAQAVDPTRNAARGYLIQLSGGYFNGDIFGNTAMAAFPATVTRPVDPVRWPSPSRMWWIK